MFDNFTFAAKGRKMKKAIMYGAGNIGRGFIGQLFSLSGYEVAFIDVNMTVINRLNADHEYPVYITEGDHYDICPVKNVCGIDGKNIPAIAEAMADADIMATAVGVNILKFIAAPFAAGVKRRMEKGIETPLNVIICENMIGADSYFAELVAQQLDSEERSYFENHFAFVEPSIGRMVPATPREIAEKNPLAVCVEPYCELPVDKAAFKGDIPHIEYMVPFAPFDFYIRRKLFMHNMSHALVAYLGYQKGYIYIWEAIADPEIKSIALHALVESSCALSAEYGVPLKELLAFSADLIDRFGNKLLGDTVERVGKDTVRKLSENDRLVGAARLCIKHGLIPTFICKGISAALYFAPEDDAPSKEVAAYAAQNGFAAALEKYGNVASDSHILKLINN